MSDFVYSRVPQEPGSLSASLRAIYHEDPPETAEYHGRWGSLAVSRNVYDGFQPYETGDHICIVLGGPVLYFEGAERLTRQGTAGTRAVLERWIQGRLRLDADLSGPYLLFIVDKNTAEITVVTDMMSFIPCYSYSQKGEIYLSSHVDVLAGASGQGHAIDQTSIVDFILHGIVTYPYTVYQDVRQIQPASIHTLSLHSSQLHSQAYWTPEEKMQYASVRQAASALRKSLQRYMNAATRDLCHAALFISAGEDSRLISALLPPEIQRDAYIFLDHMNREGRIAERAAKSCGLNFHARFRRPAHYLDILPACHDLVGSGSQYHHVHTYGFHKECGLRDYPAVFGGLLSDALVKGSRIKKLRGCGRFPFLPQIKNARYSPAAPLRHPAFSDAVLAELTKRRRQHLEYVKTFRKRSAEEWFELWPISMNLCIPNIHGNRRLFCSFEPFTDVEVVKLSAAVPQRWKLNRRLFYHAAKPLLRRTRWLLHGEGRLPAFPWYINLFVQFFVWTGFQAAMLTGLVDRNQGPWGEWESLLHSERYQEHWQQAADGLHMLEDVLADRNPKALEQLKTMQKINLLQVLYSQCSAKSKQMMRKAVG